MGVQTGLMTFAEFEKLPDPPDGHLELHHGQVVVVPPRKKDHVIIQQALYDLLAPLLRSLGFLAIELPFRAAPEHEYWVCDVGFISQPRWEADQNAYFAGAPDLVIEVLSESNTMDEMLERQNICLQNGCISFWVVDRKRQTVMVTGRNRVTFAYTSDQAVPLPEPLAGKIEVTAIFR